VLEKATSPATGGCHRALPQSATERLPQVAATEKPATERHRKACHRWLPQKRQPRLPQVAATERAGRCYRAHGCKVQHMQVADTQRAKGQDAACMGDPSWEGQQRHCVRQRHSVTDAARMRATS